jgi:hypothetical protein
MKKLLLPMAAALAALSASAFTEKPIVTFDYSNITEKPQYYMSALKASSDLAMPDGKYAWPSYSAYSADGNGVCVITGNTIEKWDTTLEEGLSVATISEKAGSAFCINGNQSGLSALYPEITAQHAFYPYYGLHWIANSNLISAVDANNYIRVRITFNATDAANANRLIEGIVVKKPGGVEVSGSSYTQKTYAEVFPEGHNADVWAVYEFDTPKTNNPSFVSFKTPAGQGKNIALLINKVEFIELTDKAESDEYITTAQVTLKEVTKTEVATPDQSKFTFGQVSVNPVAYDWTNNVISGSTANSFSVPVSVVADSRYVGYKAVYSGSVTGVWVNVANNKTSNFTITVPEVGTEAYNGYINFLPYTNTKKHTVAITSVTYSKEGEEDVTEDLSINETLGSSFSVSLGEINEVHYLVAANEDKSVLDLYAKYGFAVANSDDAVYVQYATTLNDETVESQVLTEAVEVEGTIFGFDNYTEGANWSSVAAQEGKLPILVEGVNNVGDEVKASVKLVYPFAWGAAFTEEVAESANDYTVALHQAATGEKTASITISEEEFDKATTGVANIAVAGNESVEYFNLQGVRVANPENGVFIRRQGGRASKVVLK